MSEEDPKHVMDSDDENFAPPATKTIDDMLKADENDPSLMKMKQELLG